MQCPTHGTESKMGQYGPFCLYFSPEEGKNRIHSLKQSKPPQSGNPFSPKNTHELKSIGITPDSGKNEAIAKAVALKESVNLVSGLKLTDNFDQAIGLVKQAYPVFLSILENGIESESNVPQNQEELLNV